MIGVLHGASPAGTAVANAASKVAPTPTFQPIAYPEKWNKYDFGSGERSMFTAINTCDDAKSVHQWMSAMHVCFEDFNKDQPKFSAQNYARTVHVLAKHLKDKKDIRSQCPLQGFICSWGNNASLWFNDFDAQGLVNSLWAYAVLNIALPEEFLKQYESQTAKHQEKLSQKAIHQFYLVYHSIITGRCPLKLIMMPSKQKKKP